MKAVLTKDGCNYFAGGQTARKQDGSDLPYCSNGGNGCYECCVTEQDQSGWLFCTEVAGNVVCSGKQTEFPDWWPDPDPSDHGMPGDTLPSGTTPFGSWIDDPGSGDAGGAGGFCATCPPAYKPPPAYGVPSRHHRPYRP